MRLEQKSFAEKYIEKIVLLVALLLAGWIVMTFVLGSPHDVTVGSDVKSPEAIEMAIRQKADNLHKKVNSDAVAEEIKDFEVPDYDTRFWARHDQTVVDGDDSLLIINQVAGVTKNTIVENILVEPVLPPPATKLVARDSFHVVESDEYITAQLIESLLAQYPDATNAEVEAYAKSIVEKINGLIHNQAPRDVRQNIVKANIDLEQYRTALMAVDQDLRMPASWWEPVSNFLADVVIERQTLNKETGEWGDLTEVEPIPGSKVLEFRRSITDLAKLPSETQDDLVYKSQQTTNLIEQMRFYSEDIARPQPLPYKAHTPLYLEEEAPIDIELSDEDENKLYELRKDIRKLEADLRRITGSTTVDKNAPRINDPRNPYGEGEGFGPGPIPGRSPGGRAPTGRPTPKATPGSGDKANAAAAARAKRQADRVKLLQEKLAKLYFEHDELLGLTKAVDPNNPDASVNPNNRVDPRIPRGVRGGAALTERDYLEQYGRGGVGNRNRNRPRPNANGEIVDDGKLPIYEVWNHDLTVEHGKTYRYRVIYKLINPLYQKDVTPEEVKKKFFSELLISSQPSEWSEPVSIEPATYLFVNKASAASNSATFELYSIHDGRRVKHEFNVSPGDPVGGTAQLKIQSNDAVTGAPITETVDITLRSSFVLVDVKQPPKAPGAIASRGPVTVILANTATGEIFVRNLQDDIANSQRKRLDNEAAGSLRTTVGLKP